MGRDVGHRRVVGGFEDGSAGGVKWFEGEDVVGVVVGVSADLRNAAAVTRGKLDEASVGDDAELLGDLI